MYSTFGTSKRTFDHVKSRFIMFGYFLRSDSIVRTRVPSEATSCCFSVWLNRVPLVWQAYFLIYPFIWWLIQTNANTTAKVDPRKKRGAQEPQNRRERITEVEEEKAYELSWRSSGVARVKHWEKISGGQTVKSYLIRYYFFKTWNNKILLSDLY